MFFLESRNPLVNIGITLPKFNSSPLKKDGWKTILSFWGPVYFQGRTVNFQGVLFLVNVEVDDIWSPGELYLRKPRNLSQECSQSLEANMV